MLQEEKAQHIPQIRSNIIVNHKFRFACTAAINSVITATNFLAATGTCCYTANSTGRILSETFKVKRIEVWAPPPSQGSSATCSVQWNGTTSSSLNTSALEVSDTSINPSTPAYVNAVPPKDCVGSFWNTAGTTTVCTIIAPTGSVIDVTLHYILSDDAGDYAPYSYTSGAATGGAIYYISLDGTTNTKAVSLNPNY